MGLGASDPFIAPMGLVLGYGLFFATPIIDLLPCIYTIYLSISKINVINMLFFKLKIKTNV